MSERWVINQLFKVQLARPNRSAPKERLQYEGPELQVPQDSAPLQFRWLLHPSLGLPRQPFILWRLSSPPPTISTTQDQANLPGWEQIEVIGLPVDDSWAGTGYNLDYQGPIDARSHRPTLPPVAAALQRLYRGAPPIGWTREPLPGLALPDWEPPDPKAYLEDTLYSRPDRSTLLQGIYDMLHNKPNAIDHAEYVDKVVDQANAGQLGPHLLLDGAPSLNGQDIATYSEWHPLGLLLLGAGSDPLVSLTLGFGTAVQENPEALYMVSVHHQLIVGSRVIEFEIADVVTLKGQLQAPDPPANLSASIIGHNRPQVLDGPALETVGVTWDRALNPSFSLQAGSAASPVGYVVGRFVPELRQADILLTRRLHGLDGWLPFVASKPGADEVRPVRFADHVVRSTTVGGPIADPRQLECTYAVAGQDIFGRWSTWNRFAFQGTNEPPQIPSILAVQIDVSGAVTIDFGWDWTDRSPEFIELIGANEDAPGTRLFTAHLQFGGIARPSTPAGLQVDALNAQRIPITDWGAAQDRDPAEPEVRFYRLSITLPGSPINFAGQRSRTLQVQARGQCHIHQIIPGGNVSPFGPLFRASVYDPTPPQPPVVPEAPQPPVVPEAPQWASLRDIAGVSRAVLSWQRDASVAGYVVYEATETTWLAALGCPGPDISQPFKDRLKVLRDAALPPPRSSFRRLQKELVTSTEPTVYFEVALPRGSAIMHFYAVTAMSPNQKESSWPRNNKDFIAVAVPHLVEPAAPSLEADVDADAAQPVVKLRVGLGRGPAVSKVELYRVANETLAASADTMGPPIVMLPAAGPEVPFVDITLAPDWQRVWYRAVAWSSGDDLLGLVEGRSRASPAVSVLVLPRTAPEVSNVVVNEIGTNDSKAVISWTSNAPLAVTPLGSHHIVLVAQGAEGNTLIRLDSPLDAVPLFTPAALLDLISSGDIGMARVGTQSNYRLYAWLPRPAFMKPPRLPLYEHGDRPVLGPPFSITLKMIDPLGRVGSTTTQVPKYDLPPS
jgi:hypothetical protein